MTQAAAIELADKLNADEDEGWSYLAAEVGWGYDVAVYDEEFVFVGYMEQTYKSF